MDNIDVNLFESSDDEGNVLDNERMRRPKRFRTRTNYFDDLNETEFFNRFRLKKNTCRELLHNIEDDIKSSTDRNSALLPVTKLLLTLRFYATGSMLIVAGDFMGVSKSSACVAVKIVTQAIARLSNRLIKFPTTADEREQQKIGFYNVARFPNVIGAIDCTHVRIQSPGGIDAEEYRNRKGYFSWNVQVVCDHKLKVQDIVARWPGRSHDQTIFDNSRLKARFENNEFGDSLLLGDSGYGITNYLMTPLLHPNTPAEQLYNEAHIRTRNAVERTFGVWKRRFPILSLGMRVSLRRSRAIIVATAVLHNMAIISDEENIEIPYEIEIDNNNEGNVNDRVNGKYCEFHKIYQSGDYKEAAALLISLISSRITPSYFWVTLLADALPLLECDQIVLSSSDTFTLMHFLEENSALPELTDKIDLLRLALARNLGRGLTYEAQTTE